jgi:hypothetical protein
MRLDLRRGGHLARRAPALAGLAATLLLGLAGPRLPGPWLWLAGTSWVGLLGAWVALQAGLLAYLLASAGGPGRSRTTDALVASFLAATALPGNGAAALLVPAALGLAFLRRTRVAATDKRAANDNAPNQANRLAWWFRELPDPPAAATAFRYRA